jgi:YegS/Rv2252/BmrU family lipid kinase
MSLSKFLVIVNPNAGKRKAKELWPSISNKLTDYGINFDVEFTKYRHHAIKLVKDNIQNKSYRKIIAVGGDGTINEVVNGIFQQNKYKTEDILLGVITIGTGNDWAKMFQVPTDFNEAVAAIAKENTFLQDVGKVYYHIGYKKESRYFINAAGLGFDAMVTDNTNKAKEKGKSSTFSYLSNMIKSLYKYKPVNVKVLIGQREIHRGTLFTLSLAIGQYTGGGMRQTPNAISDDGLFDLMLVDKIAKTKLIRKVKKLFDGKINKIKEVQSLLTDNLVVESDSKLLIEIDGENIGHGPLEFEMIHKGLQIIIP